MNIIDLIGNLKQFYNNIINIYSNIGNRPKYTDIIGIKKPAYIGFKNLVGENLLSIPFEEIIELEELIESVGIEIFVVNEDINYRDNNYILELLNLCKKKNIDVIFEGYTSLINLNISNSNNMFRPIDISKNPFNIEVDSVVKYNLDINYTLSIVILTCLAIYLNKTYSDKSYYLFWIIIAIMLVFYFVKEVVYVKNS